MDYSLYTRALTIFNSPITLIKIHGIKAGNQTWDPLDYKSIALNKRPHVTPSMIDYYI